MDVHCQTCHEPWDVYHLRHDLIYDAIFEGGLWHDLIDLESNALRNAVHQRWQGGQQLTPEVRESFRLIGWEFGPSILSVHRCSCCPKHAVWKPEEEHVQLDMLAKLFGRDLDGLAAELEDRRL